MDSCRIDGCEKPTHCRGMCSAHYRRELRGDKERVVAHRSANTGSCSVEHCGEPSKKRGCCGLHYQRFMKHGSADQCGYGDMTADRDRRCVNCGKDISDKKRNAKTCSRGCKNAVSHRRRPPDAWNAKTESRRDKKLDADSRRVSQADMRKILSGNGGMCMYCNVEPSAHVDHVVPLSRGGSHAIGNLAGSCAHGNLSKGKKFVAEWRRWQKRGGD